MRVEVRSVSKRFGNLWALRDVDFELPSGERAALIGPNGAGKSTLTRVLMGMLCFEGSIQLDGMPADGRTRPSDCIAYVPQIAPRLAATVADLITAIAQLRHIDPRRISDAARRLGLDTTAKRSTPFRSLSGGMRQKLLLALALCTDASLLVLDEPTASLDVESRQSFFDMVDELPHNPSVILCSHRIEEIRHLVHRVLMLQDGRVAFCGAASDYLARFAGGVLELRIQDPQGAGEPHDVWLLDLGFRRRQTGWWTLSIDNHRRVDLLRQVTARIGTDIADLVVRDFETVDPTTETERRAS